MDEISNELKKQQKLARSDHYFYSYVTLIADKASVWLCHQHNLFSFDWIFLKLADKGVVGGVMDEILDDFKNCPDWIINLMRVMSLDCWKSICDFVIKITHSVLISSFWNLQIRWRNLGQVKNQYSKDNQYIKIFQTWLCFLIIPTVFIECIMKLELGGQSDYKVVQRILYQDYRVTVHQSLVVVTLEILFRFDFFSANSHSFCQIGFKLDKQLDHEMVQGLLFQGYKYTKFW